MKINLRILEGRTWLVYMLPCFLATICYLNGMHGQFVHDDIFAIRNNPDVTGDSPLLDVFKNDFWGTRMTNFNSHRSYRPLCVLTFRLDFLIGGGSHVWFHVVNTALHVCVTLVLTCVYLQVLRTSHLCALMASSLFAVHPIHTEAVTGLVGRADVLAALFSLLSLYTYSRCIYASQTLTKHTSTDNKRQTSAFLETLTLQMLYLGASLGLATAGMLCKETGLMVLAISLLYELHCHGQLVIRDFFSGSLTVTGSLSLIRSVTLVLGSLGLLFVRLWIMNFEQPQVFEEEANPASFSQSFMTRFLTFLYLPVFNFWLLVCPSQLSYDWAGGSIPLLKSVTDVRNLWSLAFYATALLLSLISLKRMQQRDRDERRRQESFVVVMSAGLMALPFLPATNLLFRVGFVVAERVLYMPSAGYCLLVAHGILAICRRLPTFRNVLLTLFVLMLMVLSVRTLDRNQVWLTRHSLFWSGVRTLPQNAKVHYNLANLLKDEGNTQAAEEHYRIAIDLNPNVASYHLNLGTLLTNKTQAQLCFQEALKLRPQHPGALVNLGNLLLDQGNGSGMKMIKRALALNPNHFEGLITMAYAALVAENFTEADRYSAHALRIKPHSSKAHLCRGVYFHNTGQIMAALEEYRAGLKLDPRDTLALLNSARVYFTLGQLKEAEIQLQSAISLDRGCSECFALLGSVYSTQGHAHDAVITLARAFALAPNSTNISLKYVKALKDSNQRDKARLVLEGLLNQAPHNLVVLKFAFSFSMEEKRIIDALRYNQELIDLVEQAGGSSLSDLYQDKGEAHRYNGDYASALKSYEKAIQLNSTAVVSLTAAGTINFLQKNYSQAESYYLQALRLDQNNSLVKLNLDKLRNVYPNSARSKR